MQVKELNERKLIIVKCRKTTLIKNNISLILSSPTRGKENYPAKLLHGGNVS